MSASPKNHLLAFLFVALVAPLAWKSVLGVLKKRSDTHVRSVEFLKDSAEGRADTASEWDATRDQGKGSVLVDMALLVLDRSSLGEEIVVSGSAILEKDEPTSVLLSSTPAIEPSSTFGGGAGYSVPFQNGPRKRIRGSERVFAAKTTLPEGYPAHYVGLTLTLTYRGSEGATHLVQIESKGNHRIASPGSGFGASIGGRDLVLAVGSGVPYVISVGSRELAPIMMVRGQSAGEFRTAELSEWVEQAKSAAAIGAPSKEEITALTMGLREDRPGWAIQSFMRVVDPVLELAALAVHMADFGVGQEALSVLGKERGELDARMLAAAPTFRHVNDRSVAGRIDGNWEAERWAGLCLVGAIPHLELPRKLGNGNDWARPMRWISELLDPVRVHGVAVEFGAAHAAALGDMDRGYANHRVAHGRAAMTLETISENEEVQSSWDSLRRYYAGELGWLPEIVVFHLPLFYLVCLIPWLLAVVWVYVARPGGGASIELSPGWMFVLVMLTFVRFGQSPAGLITLPFWLWYARAWCRTGQARSWHRIVLVLAIGGMLTNALSWMNLVGTWDVGVPWTEAAGTFGLLALGFHFDSRGETWRSDLWVWMLSALVAVNWIPGAAIGSVGIGLSLGALGLLVAFAIGSKRDVAMEDLGRVQSELPI